MDTRTTLPLSDARKQLASIVRGVQKPNRHFTLTQHGRPVAVMLSAKDFESWSETLEVIRDFPDLVRDVKRARKDVFRRTLASVMEKEAIDAVHRAEKEIREGKSVKGDLRKLLKATS